MNARELSKLELAFMGDSIEALVQMPHVSRLRVARYLQDWVAGSEDTNPDGIVDAVSSKPKAVRLDPYKQAR